MALSQVQIVNMGLAEVGDFYISSMTEGTKQARYANIFWEAARDSLLAEHPWNFATERVRLARLASVPAWGYDYEYQLPNDCLRVLDISTDGDFNRYQNIDHKIEGRTVRTSETTVYIKYIKKVTDTSYFSYPFSMALAKRLAVHFAEPLAAMDATSKQILIQQTELAVNDAKAKDFDEGQNEQVGKYEMTAVRSN